MVPVVFIGEQSRAHWPKDLYVVPNYAFAVDCTALELRLSHEHDAMRWVPFEEAYALLWELNERLARDQLPVAE